jgi:hypothetical protein
MINHRQEPQALRKATCTERTGRHTFEERLAARSRDGSDLRRTSEEEIEL